MFSDPRTLLITSSPRGICGQRSPNSSKEIISIRFHKKNTFASAVHCEFTVICNFQSPGKGIVMHQNLCQSFFDNFDWILFILLLGGVAAIEQKLGNMIPCSRLIVDVGKIEGFTRSRATNRGGCLVIVKLGAVLGTAHNTEEEEEAANRAAACLTTVDLGAAMKMT